MQGRNIAENARVLEPYLYRVIESRMRIKFLLTKKETARFELSGLPWRRWLPAYFGALGALDGSSASVRVSCRPAQTMQDVAVDGPSSDRSCRGRGINVISAVALVWGPQSYHRRHAPCRWGQKLRKTESLCLDLQSVRARELLKKRVPGGRGMEAYIDAADLRYCRDTDICRSLLASSCVDALCTKWSREEDGMRKGVASSI